MRCKYPCKSFILSSLRILLAVLAVFYSTSNKMKRLYHTVIISNTGNSKHLAFETQTNADLWFDETKQDINLKLGTNIDLEFDCTCTIFLRSRWHRKVSEYNGFKSKMTIFWKSHVSLAKTNWFLTLILGCRWNIG